MSCGKQVGELAICFQTVHCLEIKHLDRGEISFKIFQRRDKETCVGVWGRFQLERGAWLTA